MRSAYRAPPRARRSNIVLERAGPRQALLAVEVRQRLGAEKPKILANFSKFCETKEGSFSAISTPLIARLGAFFRIFQNLQDLHSFAPLQTQNFRKNSAIFGKFRCNFGFGAVQKNADLVDREKS